MQIVIDIDEEIYQEAIKSGYSHLYDEEVANAVANGKPLPKNHGRLIDADDVNNHIIGFVNLSSCPTIIEREVEE